MPEDVEVEASVVAASAASSARSEAAAPVVPLPTCLVCGRIKNLGESGACPRCGYED